METDNNPEIKQLRKELEEITQKVEGLGGKAKEQFFSTMKNGFDTVRQKAALMKEKSQHYIEEKPWHVAAMAALLGATIAALMVKKQQR